MADVSAYAPEQIDAMFEAYKAAPDTATVAELRVLMDEAAAKAIEPPQDTSREALIELCCDAVVDQGKWSDRDSSAAHRQLGEAWALLAAGCEFAVVERRDHTILVLITYRGFNDFEYGEGPSDSDTFYLPTRKRLEELAGRDWYC